MLTDACPSPRGCVVPQNTVFVVLFAISLLIHTGQLVVARRSWFMAVMPIGCLRASSVCSSKGRDKD